MFADSLTKAGRLVELQLAFWRRPARVLTSAALASQLGIAQRTVRKYVTELSGSGLLPVVRDGRGWRLVDGARLQVLPVRFLLEEATAIYLAARLLLQHSDDPQAAPAEPGSARPGAKGGAPHPAVRGAVTKLAAVMPAEVRRPFEHLVDRVVQRGNARAAAIFTALAHGWALSRVVRLRYHPRRGEPFWCELRPYLLEPAVLGPGLYAVGRADPPGELRVLKLDRVQEAELTLATFVPPPSADLLERLDRVWGVWLSDEDPVEVRLRFDAVVARRVGETRWHPSQRLEAQADGGVVMSVRVAATVEILPWVLGWGGHCEALEPAELRARVADEVRAAVALYRPAPRSS